jgi:hypothetical protein
LLTKVVQADAASVPCYLESSHHVNLIIYGKMGFELRKEIYLLREPGKKLKMDVMVREPGAKPIVNVGSAQIHVKTG